MIDLSECSVLELTNEIFKRYEGTAGSFISAHTTQSNGQPKFFTAWSGSQVGCFGLASVLRRELDDGLAETVVEDGES